MTARISDYALIGNCRTAALVGRNGSIDWMCAPRFDSPACFAALLGSAENGRWLLSPELPRNVKRRYRPDTLILETEYTTRTGTVMVIDFMPIDVNDPTIMRIVRVTRGRVRMKMDLAIRFDYGLTIPWVSRQEDGSLQAVSGANRFILYSTTPVHGQGMRTISAFSLKTEETAVFELRFGNSFHRKTSKLSHGSALMSTEKFWRTWTSRCVYKGPHRDAVVRSLITLKALMYEPTGAIVAAPTTSLPEKPRGKRNWDYRYCWLRDATFTLLGFMHAGYKIEAANWKNWLVRVASGAAHQIRVMYGVAGERLIPEWTLPWLNGYRKSIPVRIGNDASNQFQLDIYGELTDALLHAQRAGIDVRDDFNLVVEVLEYLQKAWHLPDHGIWEVRKETRHFTHSKVMAWVAFDRGIQIAGQFRLRTPIARWKATREKIHASVCRHGFNLRLGSFVRSYGSTEVDASLLLLPLVGFLPVTDRRIAGTVNLIEKRLLRRGLVMRTEASLGTKNKGDAEGAFLPCSFWLADYYELTHQRRKLSRMLQRLLKLGNDVGLLSEEYDMEKRHSVGNFPQALSHVAMVNTIINHYDPSGSSRQRSAASKTDTLL